MKPPAKRKCLHCKAFHVPDRRNLRHQCYCSEPACQKESKRQSQRRWLAKPANQNYFRGPENSRRVQEWRAAHPGYARKKAPPPSKPLQDDCTAQVLVPQQVTEPEISHALQDVFPMQPALVVGLIATMTGSVLQEDISAATRVLIRKGQDILGFIPAAGWPFPAYENQTNSLPRAAAARASPL